MIIYSLYSTLSLFNLLFYIKIGELEMTIYSGFTTRKLE
jgi:hypothetical protein